MAPRGTESELERTRAASGDGAADPGLVVRRAPFSVSPHVGARGQRTQQRILDAAVEAFGEHGYHPTGIAQITEVAGCSRASFYQYFSSKEDVFRHLTGQVARQLAASAEALGPLTPDAEGWATLRAWVARYADIYERYEPIFHVFQSAAASDEAVATGSVRTMERNIGRIRTRVTATALSPRQLDGVIKVLLQCATRTLSTAALLRSAAPDAYPAGRVEDALADVIHRSVFALDQDVNVHPPARRRPPPLTFGPVLGDLFGQADRVGGLTPTGRRTFEALMRAGHEVFVRRGYHGTRVDDVVDVAGVSHGAFYQYFDNKDHLARVLTVRALRTVSEVLLEIPDTSDDGASNRAALRRWLRRYNTTQVSEAAMFQVWVDAALQDAGLRADSPATFDWGRRQMARFLTPRGFGDVDTEAVIMIGLLSSLNARGRSADILDAAAHVIDHGLLGRS